MSLHLTYIDVSRYMGAYLGPREELEAWVRPKAEAWVQGVRTLDKTANQYTSQHTLAWVCLSRFS